MAGESRLVPVRMPPEVVEELDRRAASETTTRSALIRAAVERFLAEPPRGLVLSGAQHRQVAQISEKYGVERLDVFGSHARGAAGAQSDVDLLYTLKPGVRLGWEIEELAAELAEVLESPVDLISHAALHSGLREAVLAEAEVLYAS